MTQTSMASDPLTLVDLASRALGGAVVHATDELFADARHLVLPTTPQPRHEFGLKGKTYDGWETRRRRTASGDADLSGADAAIVRLGAPGVVAAVVVDTAFFTGNYPPVVSIEAAAVDGHPSVEELLAARWTTIVAPSAASGDTRNVYPVTDPHRWTHVRLVISPDGGVARLRVHGVVVPDPVRLRGTVDLAAAENGGVIDECSNGFYGAPGNLLLPGPARSMGEGWETARRRGGGNEWVVVKLGAPGLLDHVVIDTSYFVGNSPAAATVSVRAGEAWSTVLDRARLQPDTAHRFPVASDAPVTHLRVDIHPDGGLARLRVVGTALLAPDG